jgi:hypothetical protein
VLRSHGVTQHTTGRKDNRACLNTNTCVLCCVHAANVQGACAVLVQVSVHPLMQHVPIRVIKERIRTGGGGSRAGLLQA